MADAAQVKQTVAKVLCCVEKVSSFASSIDPIFGIVSSLVGVARKGLVDEEAHALDKDFKEVHSKLETISQKNQQCLRQIRIDEVNETYGKYEEYIKHQYNAFNSMVAQMKKDPDNTQRHMKNFEKIWTAATGTWRSWSAAARTSPTCSTWASSRSWATQLLQRTTKTRCGRSGRRGWRTSRGRCRRCSVSAKSSPPEHGPTERELPPGGTMTTHRSSSVLSAVDRPKKIYYIIT